ncbi:MAG: hypothetical protein ACK5JT_20795 [Hyphomicrobiaceae bacterium]
MPGAGGWRQNEAEVIHSARTSALERDEIAGLLRRQWLKGGDWSPGVAVWPKFGARSVTELHSSGTVAILVGDAIIFVAIGVCEVGLGRALKGCVDRERNIDRAGLVGNKATTWIRPTSYGKL